MFADPQSVTVNAVPISCPRISVGQEEATYRSADRNLQLRVSHQTTNSRIRRMVRLDQTKIAADPLTAVNSLQKLGVYMVVDQPASEFYTVAEVDYLVDALIAWLSTANIAQVLGGES
jgi:hypothetical protein